MKRGLYLVCLIVFCYGCKNSNRIPHGIIPPAKMKAVMQDMMRADLFLGDFALRQDSGIDKNVQRADLYSQVFAIHHTSKEQFGKSFSFYRDRPALFRTIMDSISQPPKAEPAQVPKPVLLPDSIQQSIPAGNDTSMLKPIRKKKISIAD